MGTTTAHHWLEAILDKIAVALGGRAAEELFVEKITTGASDDLDKVGGRGNRCHGNNLGYQFYDQAVTCWHSLADNGSSLLRIGGFENSSMIMKGEIDMQGLSWHRKHYHELVLCQSHKSQ